MGKKVAILGGTGKMGRWFAHFFNTKGYDVVIAGRSAERTADVAKELGVASANSIEEAVNGADIVLVSTPIDVTAETIRAVKNRLTPGTVIFDIASVKRDIPKALLETCEFGARPVSVHPLFGPGATKLDGKKVIVIPILDDEPLVAWIRRLFEEEGAETYVVENGETHDQMIGVTLSLTHFVNIALAKYLSSINIQELKRFAGTTFTLQLVLTEAVLSENPNLYYAIEAHNPTFRHIVDEFLKAARRLASSLDNREEFVKMFEEAKEGLSKDPEFDSAYIRLYKALEASTNY